MTQVAIEPLDLWGAEKTARDPEQEKRFGFGLGRDLGPAPVDELVAGYAVPVDPSALNDCDSCQ